MPLLRRFRRPTLMRLLALCVLLLGVIAQPVMASVGGVHELATAAACIRTRMRTRRSTSTNAAATNPARPVACCTR